MMESQIIDSTIVSNNHNQMNHHEHHKRNIIVVSFLAIIIFVSLLISLQIVSNREADYTQTESKAADVLPPDQTQRGQIDRVVNSSFQELNEDTTNFKLEIEDLEQDISLLEEPALDVSF